MTLNKLFGKKIKELREGLHLSQEKFAELIGIQTSTVGRIECGIRFVSGKTLEKICQVLQISYAELFDFETEENLSTQKGKLKSILIQLSGLEDSDLDYFLTSIKAYKKAKKN